MSDDINYKNNPLHGLGLKAMVTEIVDHYGFEILYAYLQINSFKTKPSIDSSVKFLKKTDWAREKVEAFYLYKFKNLPKAKGKNFNLPPRERIIPDHQQPGEPADLSLADAEAMHQARQAKAAEFDRNKRKPKARSKGPYQSRSDNKPRTRTEQPVAEPGKAFDPWAKARSKSDS